MKKILSFFLVAGLFVACDDSAKKETTTETKTETTTDAKGTEADSKMSTTTTTTTSVEVPRFDDAEVQKMAEEYAAYINEGSTIGADAAKQEAYAKKGADWTAKSQPIMTKLATTPKEFEKWTAFQAALGKAQMANMPK
jgi:hypothetical protein